MPEKIGCSIMNYWPLLVIAVYSFGRWIVYILKIKRNWVSAGPIVLEPFDIDQLPPRTHERVMSAERELIALGFGKIGTCQWLYRPGQICCWTILVRQQDVAEIFFGAGN